MAQLPAAFNPNAPGQKGIEDWTPIEPGDYQAHIDDSDMVPTKDNVDGSPTGPHFLKLNWKILVGDLAGKVLIQRLNLINPNPVAVEIANKHLTSICKALNVPGPISDSQVLHGIPCIISVVKTKASAQYGEGNDIRKYAPINAGMASALPVAPAAVPAPATVPAAPPAAAAPVAVPPWLKKD